MFFIKGLNGYFAKGKCRDGYNAVDVSFNWGSMVKWKTEKGATKNLPLAKSIDPSCEIISY